jgi:hypothetical protein
MSKKCLTKEYLEEQLKAMDADYLSSKYMEKTEIQQSDWDETDTDSPAYIKNKPDISAEVDIPEWAAQPTKPTYTADEVGADAAGTAASKVAELVGTAPEALDTIYELAAAIQDNEDIVNTLTDSIGKKVDKEEGKGLSTNDFTDEYKDAIDNGAQANAIETISKNGTTLTIDENKNVNIEVPTELSELNEDSEHQTVTAKEKETWNSMQAGSGGGTQSDWEETDETSAAYILNKPTVITDVEQTATSTESGGENVYTFNKSDGTSSSFKVYNGEKGEVGSFWVGTQTEYDALTEIDSSIFYLISDEA